MNWRNGFIRAWIVMSAAWVGTIAWETYRSTSAAVGDSGAISSSILKYLALAIAPPLAVAVVGLLAWLTYLVLEAVLMRFPQPPAAGPARRTAPLQGTAQARRRYLSGRGTSGQAGIFH